MIAGAEAAVNRASANGHSQCEGAKPQEDFATSEGESRSLEMTVAEMAGAGAAVEKATAKGLGVGECQGESAEAWPEGGWSTIKPSRCDTSVEECERDDEADKGHRGKRREVQRPKS